MGNTATESFSSSSRADFSADQIWQLLQAEIKTSNAMVKNTITSTRNHFGRPDAWVTPDDFINERVGGARNSTLVALIKTPEAVFAMRQFSNDGNGKPVISLRELATDGSVRHEIHEASTVLHGHILNDFSPDLALAVMDAAKKQGFLPKTTIHGEVVSDFGGRNGRTMEKLRRVVQSMQSRPVIALEQAIQM